jgi:hypothetical protein
MIYVSAGTGTGIGTCVSRYVGLANAQTNASAGDILYLAPGNYVEPGIVLNKPLTITGPGGIIIGQ